MADRLLSTKLHVPARRPGAIPRPRLGERLERIPETRLTLVSAPPGFGKSTLLAEWAATRDDLAIAWLSLGPGDDDPARYWAYVIAALQAAHPDLGTAAADALTIGRTPIEAVLTELLNDVADRGHQTVLVLDDDHVVERAEIHESMAFLIDHAPADLHVVIATRADPPLPLSRWRARGELLELRAADLRFSPAESTAYLTGAMGLDLRAEDVAALDGRTEGWIAALQLVALSLRGRDDAARFIADFAGDDRYIVDYLVEEVLDRQDEATQAFLLRTSVLDRMTGALCDALTDRSDGATTLATLERANLFVIPLDDRRRWYRYHHLFADVLRARLLDEQPAVIAELHRLASDWFGAQGEAAEAVDHALAAGDVERAADLIELAAHDLRSARQEATLRRWLDGLPDEVFATRPVLALAHVGALLATGQVAGVEARLDDAERWIDAAAGSEARAAAEANGMVARHPHALAHLPSAIPLYRAALARMRGDADATIAQARRALEAAGPDQPLERGGAAGMLALAFWNEGRLAEAEGAWLDAIDSLAEGGHLADVHGCTIAVGDIRVTQGRLTDAARAYEEALRRTSASSSAPLRGAADMHVGLAEVALERSDLGEATRHLEAAGRLGETLGLPQYPYRSRVALARLRRAMGDPVASDALLEEAIERYDGDFFPDVRPVAAVRARGWIAQDRLAEARAWAGAVDLAPDDDLTFVREYEHATLARLLLAEGSDASAVGLAERLAAAAVEGGRARSAIDALVVVAVGHRVGRDRERAVATLEGALEQAAPEGIAEPFLAAGAPLLALLGEVRPTPFVRSLLDLASTRRRPTAPSQPIAEPLSDRELEVLRLLQGDLAGPDLARELYVSLNTLRTHTKNVYAKLGVNSRRAAVRRGVELGLLPAEGPR